MKKCIATVCTAFFMGAAQAGDWYVGGGIGSATADNAGINAAATLKSVASTLKSQTSNVSASGQYDESGHTVISLLAGYKFTPYLAAEAAYDFLGSYTFHGTFTRSDLVFIRTEKNEVSAVSLSAVLTAPIKQAAAIYGKIGVAATTNNMTCAISGGSCASESDSNNTRVLGIGGALHLYSSELRLEYDRFHEVGDKRYEYTAGTFSLAKLMYVYTFNLE